MIEVFSLLLIFIVLFLYLKEKSYHKNKIPFSIRKKLKNK